MNVDSFDFLVFEGGVCFQIVSFFVCVLHYCMSQRNIINFKIYICVYVAGVVQALLLYILLEKVLHYVTIKYVYNVSNITTIYVDANI